MIDVGRQPEVGIGAALVCCQYQFALIDLELYQAEARGLVALGIGSSEEEYIVLAIAFLAVYLLDQRWQLLEIAIP